MAAQTSTEYIQHHLQNLVLGLHPENGFGFARSAAEAKAMGFWAIHVDTMLWSVVLGALFLWVFRKAARTATSDVPTPFQNFIETVIEFIDGNVRGTFTGKNDLVAPIALTLFVWILLMNTMDLVPVDWIPWLAHLIGVPYMKVVPTADPNTTFGMSLSVFVLTIYYSIKVKGPGGFFGELAFQPFPKIPVPHQPVPRRDLAPLQAGIAVAAAVRKPVCRRDDLHSHRAALQRRVLVGPDGGSAAMGVGGIPSAHRHVAGVHLHDPDDRVPGHGTFAPLIGFVFLD